MCCPHPWKVGLNHQESAQLYTAQILAECFNISLWLFFSERQKVTFFCRRGPCWEVGAKPYAALLHGGAGNGADHTNRLLSQGSGSYQSPQKISQVKWNHRLCLQFYGWVFFLYLLHWTKFSSYKRNVTDFIWQPSLIVFSVWNDQRQKCTCLGSPAMCHMEV